MFNAIKKILHSQKLFQGKEDVYDKREGIRPGTDWTIIFSSTLGILVLVGIVGWYIDNAIEKGTFFAERQNQIIDTSTTLNQTLLKEFKDRNIQHQNNIQSIRDKGVPVEDPSL